MKYSEKRQEYLFPDQLNNLFLLPKLPLDWHLKPGVTIKISPPERPARNHLLASDNADDEAFIGYPVSSFISPTGTHCLCPIILFPVIVRVDQRGRSDYLSLEIDRAGITLNQDWIEYHIPLDQQKRFIRACRHNTAKDASLDVDCIFEYISNHFRLKGEKRLNPTLLDFSINHKDARDGILNTAVLFIGNKTKYTRTLMRELAQIANEPDEVLDRTALAYVFRTPPLKVPAVSPEEKIIPATFTSNPLNYNQFKAVEEALNTPVTKVTGPPGTGKSHMSVNLIANEVFNGGSVLFTSKNHKAVHAIFDMCPEAAPDTDFPLIEFCTAPGNDSAAKWDAYQPKIEERKGLVYQRVHPEGEGGWALPEELKTPDKVKADQALSLFRDAEEDLREYQRLRDRLSELERLMLQVDDLLAKVPLAQRGSADFEKLLHEIKESLRADKRLSLSHRLFVPLLQHLGLMAKKPSAREHLNDLMPGFAAAFQKYKSIAREVHSLLRILEYKRLATGWEFTARDELKKELSECNYEALKSSLVEADRTLKETGHSAFLERLLLQIDSIDEKDLVPMLKGAVNDIIPPESFMASIGTGKELEPALELEEKFLTIYPAWATTLLSLKRAAPCLPGIFSLVIIDEASQCEIPPMIPALYRARRACIIGDTKQFPPVITIRRQHERAFREKYGIAGPEYQKFSFLEDQQGKPNSVFNVVPAKAFTLREHFRCADAIANYFNDEFYKGSICPCVGDRSHDKVNWSAYGLKPGMDWRDASGGDDAEIECALQYLREKKQAGFTGTIGVISPLRKIANLMKTIVFKHKDEMPSGLDLEEHINTANGFQGGQCDLILFLLGLNPDRKHGETWYITSDDNRYIFNVSVSRARVCFVTIGDKDQAEATGLSRIIKLIPSRTPPRSVKIGPGEKVLQDALSKAGIETAAQYPICNRYLDLAIPSLQIDIEVDGQAYHLDINGNRKAEDIHRDILLESNGWRVVRFWHPQVMEDVDKCVEKVKEIMRERETELI